MKSSGKFKYVVRTLPLAAAALIALSAGASASVTVHTSPFISSPTYYTDFTSFGAACGPSWCTSPSPYSDGGIDVSYSSIIQLYNDFPTAPSGNAWYPGGGNTGYTDITLTGGGSFSAIQISVSSGWYGGGADLIYQLLNGSTVVATGDAGPLSAYGGNFDTYGFSGATFTEVRLQGPMGSPAFDVGNFEALAVGSVGIGSSVPEPSTWAMMIAGFAGLGFAGYWASRKSLAVSA